jgi:hypothetical protein
LSAEAPMLGLGEPDLGRGDPEEKGGRGSASRAVASARGREPANDLCWLGAGEDERGTGLDGEAIAICLQACKAYRMR